MITVDGNRIVMSGEIDMAVDVRTAIDGVLAAGHDTVVFDVSRVTFMDSTGLAGLLYARTRAEVELVGVTPTLRRLLDIIAW